MDLAGKSTNVFLEFKPNEEANNGGATPGCICPGRNTTALAAKSGNNEIFIMHHDILTALADATNDLPMPCHEQRPGPGAATGS